MYTICISNKITEILKNRSNNSVWVCWIAGMINYQYQDCEHKLNNAGYKYKSAASQETTRCIIKQPKNYLMAFCVGFGFYEVLVFV